MHVLRMNTWDCYDEGEKLNRIDKSSIGSFKKLDFQVLTSTKITEKCCLVYYRRTVRQDKV